MTPEGILRARKRREGHALGTSPLDAVTVENPISAVVRRPAHFALQLELWLRCAGF